MTVEVDGSLRSGSGGPPVSAGSAVRLAGYLDHAWEPRGYRSCNAYCGRAIGPRRVSPLLRPLPDSAP